MNRRSGFTLIETLVYLFLFAIIIGGAIVSVFNIFQLSERTQTKTIVQEEGDFLLAKIDWALTGIQAVTAPAPGSSGTVLSVNKLSGVSNPLLLILSGTKLQIQKGVAAPITLNNGNIVVSALTFTHIGSGSNQESLEASFTLTTRTATGQIFSQDFSTAKYLRK